MESKGNLNCHAINMPINSLRKINSLVKPNYQKQESEQQKITLVFITFYPTLPTSPTILNNYSMILGKSYSPNPTFSW